MHGTGSEVGNTITLYDESGRAVATTTVGEDGKWSIDISNLENTPNNDNEFFKVTETDAAGNQTAQTDTTHYWYGTWKNAQTDDTDDYVMSGSGDDKMNINDNDLNDYVVFDGGNGNDTAVFNGKRDDYTISVNEKGDIVIIENISTDSNGDGIGDINVLRNVEKVKFSDGEYDVEDGKLVKSATLLDEGTTLVDSLEGFDHVSNGSVILTKYDDESENKFSFGEDNANKTVEITFEAQAGGSWDNSGRYEDTFLVNDQEITLQRGDGPKTFTIQATTDENGDLELEFEGSITGRDESVTISNLEIKTVGDDWLSTALDENKASESDDSNGHSMGHGGMMGHGNWHGSHSDSSDSDDNHDDGDNKVTELIISKDDNIDLSVLSDDNLDLAKITLDSGDQNITISIEDVLNVTDDNNTLIIQGDQNDNVTLEGNWENKGTTNIDGEEYEVYQGEYQGSTANVLIDLNHNIQVDES